jgi:hypothetical protein
MTGSSVAASAQEARFGDSTWVAPYPIATEPGDPTADGPRVARKDREPTGESILRTPFRVAFLPVRLLARGIEWGAGIAIPELKGPPIRIGFYTEVAKLTPSLSYSSDTGLEPGFEIRRRSFREDVPNIRVAGGWSTKGQRDAMARVVAGLDTTIWGVGVEGRYKIVPNYRFYGIGNIAPEGGRSIYRDERGDISMWMQVGPNPLRHASLLGGYSSISSSGGSRGSPALQDVFDPSTVPFFGHDSKVYWFGAGGDWSWVNHWREPSAGFHARGDIRRFHSTDRSAVKYVELRGDVRGYVPVFATRRVLALRFLYDGVNPDGGSAEIPFYRLPSSFGEYRFAAYHSNQFRDQVLAIAHVEYRWYIMRGLQAVGFAQLGEVASRAHNLRIAEVHESYGGGFRFPLKKGTAVRAIFAKGSEGPQIQLIAGSDF